MKLPEFNLFSDKSARIFLIFSSISPNFYGFPKFGGTVPPPPHLPPVSYAYVGPEHSTTEMSMRCTANATVSSCLSRQEMCRTWLGNIQRISPSVWSRKL